MINLLVFAGVMFFLIRIYIITSTKPFVCFPDASPKDYSLAQFKFFQLTHPQILSILSTVYKSKNFTLSYISKMELDKKTQDIVITLGDNTYSAFDAFYCHKEKLSLSYPYTGKTLSYPYTGKTLSYPYTGKIWIQDRRKAQESKNKNIVLVKNGTSNIRYKSSDLDGLEYNNIFVNIPEIS